MRLFKSNHNKKLFICILIVFVAIVILSLSFYFDNDEKNEIIPSPTIEPDRQGEFDGEEVSKVVWVYLGEKTAVIS